MDNCVFISYMLPMQINFLYTEKYVTINYKYSNNRNIYLVYDTIKFYNNKKK